LPDVVSSEKRSEMMAGIRSANTRPEMLIRRALHARGWRYRLHDSKLPGRPDLVFARRNAVLFVNGCFWHGHDCHLFKWPKSRELFWRDKIAGNISRDLRTHADLRALGWRVADVWECALKGREQLGLEKVIGRLDSFLSSDVGYCSVGTPVTVGVR
jgi:DNA mismatch endonuclease (patch repair protein)